MSYRTYVNGFQLFGNNDYHEEWIDFIKSQGISVSEDGIYQGEITDFMGALKVLEQITLNLVEETKERNKDLYSLGYDDSLGKLSDLFDFTNIPEEIKTQDEDSYFKVSLFDKLSETIQHGYAFLPYSFYLACQETLEKDRHYAVEDHYECFKLKEGKTIRVCAS